ncbi:hypothetical protein [Rhodopirellula bahusiensis]
MTTQHFATRSDRDAFFSQRELNRDQQQSESIQLELPDSMVTALRALIFLFKFAERAIKLVWFVLAAMMATILLGIVLGILAA